MLTEEGALATRRSKPSICLSLHDQRFELLAMLECSTLALPMKENHLTCFWVILSITPGQKVATLPSVTTTPVGLKHTIGARQHLHETRIHQSGRRRNRGTNPTSGRAAAPGAAGIRPHTPRPETEAPARPSPHITNRTTPGETSLSSVTLF